MRQLRRSQRTKTRPRRKAVGSLRVVVQLATGSTPIAGAKVRIADFETETAADGSITLDGSAATFAVRVEVPPSLLPGRTDPTPVVHKVPSVTVAAGSVTQVMVTLAPDGTLVSADITGPTPIVAAPAEDPNAKGTIQGVVVSAENKTPIQGAGVYVRGAPEQAESGADGAFTLALPPGSYSISVSHPDFATQAFEDIAVTASAATDLTLELQPASTEYADYIVRARAIRGTVASIMEERRATAAVSDAIGSEDISRMPAADAAQAAQRVVGATIVGGRYVYVRGLGERYTNAQLNGSPLPSPEPDRATVPLDLFPAQILESLNISKTFTPDVPGDFAGGSVRIVTRSIPEGPMFAASLGIGANTQATFTEGMGQEGSSTDWLGFDDGKRELSPEIPTDYKLGRNAPKPDGTRVTDEERDEAGIAANTRMSTKEQTLPPNGNGSILAGSSWKISPKSTFGILGSLIYRRSFNNRAELVQEFEHDGAETSETGLSTTTSYHMNSLGDDVRWGGLAGAGLDFNADHRQPRRRIEHQRLAKQAFTEAGVAPQRVRLIPGAALDVLPRLTDGHYDLVFCDGDKTEYSDYLAEAMRLLKPGGIVAFDNALWHTGSPTRPSATPRPSPSASSAGLSASTTRCSRCCCRSATACSSRRRSGTAPDPAPLVEVPEPLVEVPEPLVEVPEPG